VAAGPAFCYKGGVSTLLSRDNRMIDLHTHTYFSDGVLGPAELARRCQVQGYQGLVITDHCDASNLEFTIVSLARFCEETAGAYEGLEILPGCELTHVPPHQIGDMVQKARELGAEVVLIHGETIVEPVAPGTDRAAIEAGCDVVAHPGLITPEEVAMAAGAGVLLELSGRKGHSLTNGHVARLAFEKGALLSFGSDGHAPGDYPTRETALGILRGAGLTDSQAVEVLANNARFFAAD
jgi:putative hydrolase